MKSRVGDLDIVRRAHGVVGVEEVSVREFLKKSPRFAAERGSPEASGSKTSWLSCVGVGYLLSKKKR